MGIEQGFFLFQPFTTTFGQKIQGLLNPGNPVSTGDRERIRTSDLPLRSNMNGNENAERISIIGVTRSCSSQFSSHFFTIHSLWFP